jgi:hypothetical protein
MSYIPSIGQLVSVARWDKHDPPSKQLGSPATVIGVRKASCESGFMVKVRGSSGMVQDLDSGWIEKIQNRDYD